MRFVLALFAILSSCIVMAESAPAKITRRLKPRFDTKVKPTARMTKFKQNVHVPNHGFTGAVKETKLVPGTVIDRFGSPWGYYGSPAGTPKAMRSLIPSTTPPRYMAWIVAKPIPVKAGRAGAFYGQPGGGTQYLFEHNVEHLFINGYLRHASVQDLFRVVHGTW